MTKRTSTGWRTTMVIGWLAGAGALCPLAVYAQADQTPQAPQPSGAAIAVGGVSSTNQGRPLVLPNTGTGPANTDETWALMVAAGIGAIGAGAFLRGRASGRARSRRQAL